MRSHYVRILIGAAFAWAGAIVSAQDRVVDRAFADYDRIYLALAEDSLEGVSGAAAALEPLAREVAGATAGTAAAALAKAETLESARARFGEVSEALVACDGGHLV
jgi:hypothetical protein